MYLKTLYTLVTLLSVGWMQTLSEPFAASKTLHTVKPQMHLLNAKQQAEDC